jgi:hypothetical protein
MYGCQLMKCDAATATTRTSYSPTSPTVPACLAACRNRNRLGIVRTRTRHSQDMIPCRLHSFLDDRHPARVDGFLFRGQRDASWSISPSIEREPDRAQADSALWRFIAAFMHLSRMADGPVPEDAYIAAAQHYGLPTPFVDFSWDPRIAGFFASDRSGREDAAIHWRSSGSAAKRGLNLVIPPFWVRRLYRQKGCFLDFGDVSFAERENLYF